jgi:hypothetical protein
MVLHQGCFDNGFILLVSGNTSTLAEKLSNWLESERVHETAPRFLPAIATEYI